MTAISTISTTVQTNIRLLQLGEGNKDQGAGSSAVPLIPH